MLHLDIHMHLPCKYSRRSAVEIETAACELLQRFQPDIFRVVSSFDVENFFDVELHADTHIEAIYSDLPDGLEGFTDSLNMQCFISQKLADHGGRDVQARRLRSTIAHEIGHCYLHVEEARQNRQFQQMFKNDASFSFEMYRPEDLKAYENPEWQAWRFASALLMPEPPFRCAVDRNWTKTQIKHGFDVNPSFIDVRLRELKITKSIRNG